MACDQPGGYGKGFESIFGIQTLLPAVFLISLIVCLFKESQEPSFAHAGLSLCWAFLCKTFWHLVFSLFQFKCLL